MRYIHNAKITIFLKPEEYFGNNELIEKIKNVFCKLVPIDYTREKLSIKEEIVESFENRKIKIYSLEISKEAHTNIFINNLKELLGKDQCEIINSQKESRLDDELFFYLRLNKEYIIKDVIELTDGGDCVHIRMHIASFPKNKDNALKVIDEIFK
ncbi:MAG: RNA-binding domain-containing protein [Candidatus Woesearchaeota archaeon]